MCFTHGEMLDAEGNFYHANYRSAKAEVEYICRAGKQTWHPHLTFFGFRYLKLLSWPGEARPESFTAIVVHSNMKRTGWLESGDPLLNQLFSNIVWGQRGNFLDVPTDCPQRDERLGWTGDAQVFFETASYLFDYAAFSQKNLRDVYDWQKRDGRLPQIAPYGGVDFYMWTLNGSVGWSDIGILLPYRFWKKYGDRNTLTEYYDRMRKYAAFMIRRVSPDGVVRLGQSYGEWAEPEDVMPNVWTNTVLPHPEVSTAYTAYVLRCLDVLADIDIEAAYRLLENEEMPGWLFMPKAGATTIWESWEGTEAQGGIASFNHYSKGAVVEWLFKTMCGIRVDGKNHFTIAPRPGGRFTFAKASYDSVFGTVESAWKIEDGKTVYTLTIPANSSASVTISGREYELASGTYALR